MPDTGDARHVHLTVMRRGMQGGVTYQHYWDGFVLKGQGLRGRTFDWDWRRLLGGQRSFLLQQTPAHENTTKR